MSLNIQKETLDLARRGIPFSARVLAELGVIDGGNDFVEACNGSLDLSGFMDILACCDQSTVDRIITTNEEKKVFLDSENLNSFIVLENEAVYYTADMDATIQWFEDILGWEGIIDVRNESGQGVYGYLKTRGSPSSPQNRSPYLQLMIGESMEIVVAFIKVWGVHNLHRRLTDKGWEQVTPVIRTGWGADLFEMTTCDGSIIRFYEPPALGL